MEKTSPVVNHFPATTAAMSNDTECVIGQFNQDPSDMIQSSPCSTQIAMKAPRFFNAPESKEISSRPSGIYRLGKNEKNLDLICTYIKSLAIITCQAGAGPHQCLYPTQSNAYCDRTFNTFLEAVTHVDKHLTNAKWRCRFW